MPLPLAKAYNAPGAEAPGRYTKGDCSRNQETKFLPPESVAFDLLQISFG